MENKGFNRFKTTKAGKTFSINTGTINVDKKVFERIQKVVKKYGNSQKYGALAVKNEGDAIALLLEHYLYQKNHAYKAKAVSKGQTKV